MVSINACAVSVLIIVAYDRNKHGQQKSKEKRYIPTDRGIYTTTTTTTTTDQLVPLQSLHRNITQLWSTESLQMEKNEKDHTFI